MVFSLVINEFRNMSHEKQRGRAEKRSAFRRMGLSPFAYRRCFIHSRGGLW
jgi:hypothetical protein